MCIFVIEKAKPKEDFVQAHMNSRQNSNLMVQEIDPVVLHPDHTPKVTGALLKSQVLKPHSREPFFKTHIFPFFGKHCAWEVDLCRSCLENLELFF